ncbi:hypothetical protein BO83DRAFT_184523 [Aspergillus eucalypticola CBS 122712]|uniref:Uncharacterized protein n=1 Tax=Aspergillus eucalypticola (strain CBS 122712 / IBT 29274) TaxID=1448314 RepID=A0A317UNM5_ASPEC|nr:uncharacterized protein BO83DRAFT_184523 [Aspergillus eucalypticola CBS 122712]PWY62748.1 hypothetical protein BO83DRAFT_184523 [Aspergillus eucalypticola CBS 122712]
MWDKSRSVRLHCGKFVFLFSAHSSIHPSSLGPCRLVHRSCCGTYVVLFFYWAAVCPLFIPSLGMCVAGEKEESKTRWAEL